MPSRVDGRPDTTSTHQTHIHHPTITYCGPNIIIRPCPRQEAKQASKQGVKLKPKYAYAAAIALGLQQKLQGFYEEALKTLNYAAALSERDPNVRQDDDEDAGYTMGLIWDIKLKKVAAMALSSGTRSAMINEIPKLRKKVT